MFLNNILPHTAQYTYSSFNIQSRVMSRYSIFKFIEKAMKRGTLQNMVIFQLLKFDLEGKAINRERKDTFSTTSQLFDISDNLHETDYNI